jgi:hypothetical protein
VSRSNDDRGMTPRRPFDDRMAERLLSGHGAADEPELTSFVAELSGALPSASPAPSDQLAAMLESGIPAGSMLLGEAAVLGIALHRRPAVSWRMSRWGWAAMAVAAATAGVLGAAAANTLPSPAQTAVSDVVGWVTPLHLPKPGDPSVVPVGTPSPSPSDDGEHSAPTPRVSESPDDQGDASGSGSGDSGSGGSDDGASPRPSSGSDDGTTSGGGSGSGGSDDTHVTPAPSASSDSGSGSGSGDSGSGGGGSDDHSPTPAPSQSDSSGSGGSSDDGQPTQPS